MDKLENETVVSVEEQEWVKPAVTSFAPVRAAEGINYLPTDGLFNLTP